MYVGDASLSMSFMNYNLVDLYHFCCLYILLCLLQGCKKHSPPLQGKGDKVLAKLCKSRGKKVRKTSSKTLLLMQSLALKI